MSTQDLNADELLIYPNPAKDLVTVKLENPCELVVLDAFGKVVLKQRLNQGEQQVSLEGVASGAYFFKVGDRLIKIVKR